MVTITIKAALRCVIVLISKVPRRIWAYPIIVLEFILLLLLFLERSFDVQGHESFVSHEGLEQLHRFIFVMAVTHVTYSCLTMLLAILKVLTLLYFYIKHKLILSIKIHSTIHTYLENWQWWNLCVLIYQTVYQSIDYKLQDPWRDTFWIC